jgi:hypothetical protein
MEFFLITNCIELFRAIISSISIGGQTKSALVSNQKNPRVEAG